MRIFALKAAAVSSATALSIGPRELTSTNF
jgi:hypothetical protein